MKKFLIGAAIALAITSCGAILDTLVNGAVFTVPSKLYDGQWYRLTRVGSCFYEWRLSNDEVALITYLDKDGNPVAGIENSENGNARLSVKLKSDMGYKDLTVYAKNHEDDTQEEQDEETTIVGWALAAYGENLNEPLTGAVTYTAGKTLYIGMTEIDASNFKPKKNGRVVGDDEKNAGSGIKIGFKDSKDQYTGLDWEISGGDASKYEVEKMNTLLKFTPKAGLSGNITITATLGKEHNKLGAVSHSITIGN